jgi:hypothetical protein
VNERQITWKDKKAKRDILLFLILSEKRSGNKNRLQPGARIYGSLGIVLENA